MLVTLRGYRVKLRKKKHFLKGHIHSLQCFKPKVGNITGELFEPFLVLLLRNTCRLLNTLALL